ncbi:MAG: PAS domain-containing protein [Ginsengibacter sp.]
MDNKKTSFNLLVVEDNPGDYILLKEWIGLTGLPVHKIFHAENMEEVPELLKDKAIDIVLLDLSLPDSTGIESVKTIDRLLPNKPIIVLSGFSAIDIAIKSISHGAQDYLVKVEYDEKLLAKTIQYSMERKRTLKKLELSNERYELISKATLDTIWEWDFNTETGLWSDGITKIYGYAKGDIVSDMEWTIKYIHPDDFERAVSNLKAHIQNKTQNFQDEYRFKTADGSYKYIFVRTYILFNAEKKTYRMIKAFSDVTEQKRLEKELSEATILAQEKERDELGKELHDNINQILAATKMYLGMAKGNNETAADLIEKSYEFVNIAIEEIRQLSKTLVAPSLDDSSLESALQNLVDDLNATNTLTVKLLYRIAENQITDKKKELMLYRIAQEQITNIRKHAKAQKATIVFKADAGKIYLSIIDDGIGYDPEIKANGIGLKNILSRVKFYSGDMNIKSAPGKGFKLNITVPV